MAARREPTCVASDGNEAEAEARRDRKAGRSGRPPRAMSPPAPARWLAAFVVCGSPAAAAAARNLQATTEDPFAENGALSENRGAEEDAPAWHAVAEALLMALGVAALVAYWLSRNNKSPMGSNRGAVGGTRHTGRLVSDGSTVAAVGNKGVQIRTASNRADETIGKSLLGSNDEEAED